MERITANSPFEARVDAVMRVINRHADRTGKKVVYAFNISSETDNMLHNAATGTRWTS